MGATCSTDETSCNSPFAGCKSGHCQSSCTKVTKTVLDSTQIDEMICAALKQYQDKMEQVVIGLIKDEIGKHGIVIDWPNIQAQLQEEKKEEEVLPPLPPPLVRQTALPSTHIATPPRSRASTPARETPSPLVRKRRLSPKPQLSAE